MEAGDSSPLAGAEINGFQTAADLDIGKLMEDASTRWFRPNEVHAILSNYTRFKIQPQPVNIPTSGSVLLFDRKMLRNFRKDGHNWKKKKDGKTVQEAHEKLKIGNEERIHVYYARSEDDLSFYRRCYWLLDKNLERIVLVHYRHTSEENAVEHLPTSAECPEALSLANKTHQGSPLTPVNSTSVSAHSEVTGSASLSEEINSGEDYAIYGGSGVSLTEKCNEIQQHELSLHEINTLEWADLVEAPACIDSTTLPVGDALSYDKQMQYESRNSMNNGSLFPSQGTPFENSTDKQISGSYFQMGEDQEGPSPLHKTMNSNSQETDLLVNPACINETLGIFNNDNFLSQSSFGRWNYMNDDSVGSLPNLQLEIPNLNGHTSDAPVIMNDSLTQEQVFCITDISPTWAYCSEETKVLVIGYFCESHKHLEGSNIYCVFGEICVAAEIVQAGVYRCTALPQTPGLVNLYLTLDGHTPISQVLSFDYRSVSRVELNHGSLEGGNKFKSKDFQVQIRVAHLLFSTTNNISILSSRQTKFQKEAKRFASLTSPSLEKDWISLLQSSSNNDISYKSTSHDLFELVLKNKLQEWLLEKVADGCKTTAHDSQGQGVIHLCAILDYAWVVRMFSFSGMSLDFRDAFGWTALHWAAYCGREKMVAALLSAGANPSLVTDPTAEWPGGCTAADLASRGGYEGLAAYLAEKGLAAHFHAMSLSGNITAPPPSKSTNQGNLENVYSANLSEQDVCLKESLAAYRNAADAADRIQAAFRERSLKLQTKAVQLAKPEMEAAGIVAALKIQHAFRNYNRRKVIRAAARIQNYFRTWQTRKNYLYVRRQAIKIQSVFRGHQVRKQYRKITWSVGVLEKAILRWRLKRKGLRGIQVAEVMRVDTEQENSVEEDFYRVSRVQAEDRVKRSVIRVQAMFRSYRAQQEYRRMKLAHDQAKLEYNELMGPSQC